MTLLKGAVFFSILSTIFVVYLIKKHFEEKVEAPEISIGNGQTQGERDEQEDSFATIKAEDDLLAVVADGMGGYGHGKKASKLAVDTFLEQFSRQYNIEEVNKFLINSSYISNDKVIKMAEGRKIGTTLVSVFIRNDLLYWSSAGDSHIYLFKGEKLKLLNTPHTYENLLKEAYSAGEISRDKLLNSPKKERLTSYIGYDDFHEVDYSECPIPLESGDKILLCSDGLYKTLSDLELEDTLAKDVSPQEISSCLIDMVENKNIVSQDNATLIVLKKN